MCVANGNRYLVTIAALVAVVERLAHGDDGVVVIVPFAAITMACIKWQLEKRRGGGRLCKELTRMEPGTLRRDVMSAQYKETKGKK